MTDAEHGPGPADDTSDATDTDAPPKDRARAVEVDEEDEAPHPAVEEPPLGHPGKPLSRKAPYVMGLLAGFGLLTAFAFGYILVSLSSVILQVVVALFIAVGLNPAIRLLEHRLHLRRGLAVLIVILGLAGVLTLFFYALVPVISEQVQAISANVPGWIDDLQDNRRIQEFNNDYQVLDKVQDFFANGDFISTVLGGALGVGLAVLGFLGNAFFVIVLTLYFVASLETTKKAIYNLAPASRRDRVSKLGDRVLDGIGGYVSGAVIVALCAGISSLVFLFIVGMGDYAVALAFVVMLTDIIPMIGATIGAVVVCAITFAVDVKTGIIAVIFFVAYQQFENYVIYPRVMSRSVDIPGLVIVIAVLVGASLLGVIGVLIAIPIAAAILMITREVFVRAQDQR